MVAGPGLGVRWSSRHFSLCSTLGLNTLQKMKIRRVFRWFCGRTNSDFACSYQFEQNMAETRLSSQKNSFIVESFTIREKKRISREIPVD